MIAPFNRAALYDRRVHTDMAVIVLNCRAQNPRIVGEISLRQRRHHAACAGFRNAQAHLVSDRHLVIDLSLLDKSLLPASRIHDDIGTEARRLKASLGIQLVKPVKTGRGHEMDNGAVEKGSGW